MKTPTIPPVRNPRKKKATDEIAAMKAQLEALTRERDALKATVSQQDTLIAQLVKDTQLDAALIDEMASRIRDSQTGYASLPHHVDFDWLTQSKADKKSANDELSRKWAEGWRIFHIENSMLARDVTLWRPAVSAMKVPVQARAGSTSAVIPVIVNTVEDDPEDFDATAFIQNSNLRMAQSALSAFKQFERNPFFRPAGLRDVRIIVQ